MPEYAAPDASVFEHTYTRPLYKPSAPSGAQNEPGRPEICESDEPPEGAVDDATVVAVTARVVVGASVVVAATGVVAATVFTVGTTATGGAFHPRIVVPAHCPVNRLLRRPHSLWSIERFQRAFTDTQFDT